MKESRIEAMVFYDHGGNGVQNREITIQQDETGETNWSMDATKKPFPEHFEAGLSCITGILIVDMRTPQEIAQSPIINSN